MNSQSEFYVGYLPMPAKLRVVVRRIAVALGALAAALGISLALALCPFAPAAFEYRQYRDFEGVLVSRPYPALIGADGLAWLLVAPGKHGFTGAAQSGSVVRLRGQRIWRGGDRMIEVDPPSVRISGAGTPPPESELGPVELTGEIVDSKCYFGVMNPGNGKVHRDCAARCIAGGVPPAFLVRDAAGRSATLLLANWRRELLEHVAEPVTLRGRIARAAGRLVLYLE